MAQLSTLPNIKWRRILVAYLSGVIIILSIILINIWPVEHKTSEQTFQVYDSLHTANTKVADSTNTAELDSLISKIGANSAEIPDAKTMIIIIMLVGSLGASLHGLVSLSEYAGNKSFDVSWSSWYVVRPFVGGILSLLFYFVVRGGFLTNAADFDTGEFYTLVAMSSLVGLFSKQALYKLSDIFDVIFRSVRENYLKDKITRNPVPDIDSVDPAEISMSSEKITLTIQGSDFIKESVVVLNTNKLKTTFISSKKLSAELKTSDFTGQTNLEVSVSNPPPEGGTSKSILLSVVD